MVVLKPALDTLDSSMKKEAADSKAKERNKDLHAALIAVRKRLLDFYSDQML